MSLTQHRIFDTIVQWCVDLWNTSRLVSSPVRAANWYYSSRRVESHNRYNTLSQITITLFTLSLTRPSPKLPSPVWPWPGEPSDLHWLGKSCIVGALSHLHLAWPGLRQILPCITYRKYEHKKARSARVCVYTWPSPRSSPRQSSRGWPVWQG